MAKSEKIEESAEREEIVRDLRKRFQRFISEEEIQRMADKELAEK